MRDAELKKIEKVFQEAEKAVFIYPLRPAYSRNSFVILFEKKEELDEKHERGTKDFESQKNRLIKYFDKLRNSAGSSMCLEMHPSEDGDKVEFRLVDQSEMNVILLGKYFVEIKNLNDFFKQVPSSEVLWLEIAFIGSPFDPINFGYALSGYKAYLND